MNVTEIFFSDHTLTTNSYAPTFNRDLQYDLHLVNLNMTEFYSVRFVLSKCFHISPCASLRATENQSKMLRSSLWCHVELFGSNPRFLKRQETRLFSTVLS